MSLESRFTADHHGFYRDGKPFVPSESNLLHVRLPAHLSDDLNWPVQVPEDKAILWELDLGLPFFEFLPDNTAAFFSFSIAIEEFSRKLWPAFHHRTFGVALYRGPLPTEKQFPSAHWDAHLCRIQLLSEYLHRLVSFLPDTVLPFAFFNETLSPMQKAKFEHIHLTTEAPPSTSLGLYLPADADVELNGILERHSVRIIPEEKLTEQWDGIEKLIVPDHPISATGRRKLLGFIAAGGEVVNENGASITF